MKNKLKWLAGFFSLSLCMLLVSYFLGNTEKLLRNTSAVSADAVTGPVTVVIDAGHGGEDGGCIGADGTLEKDLNLTIAKNVSDMLSASGVSVRLVRQDDALLYDMYGDLEDYTGKKKTYDLKNRVRFAKESECEIFVSIHMNKFTQPEYNGLQVYYSGNDSDSITAALRIQEHVRDYLQPDNDRQIKRAGSNIYLLHRLQMPAVLVECGFLSNPYELENLKDPEYQKKLSLCITAGILDGLAGFVTK